MNWFLFDLKYPRLGVLADEIEVYRKYGYGAYAYVGVATFFRYVYTKHSRGMTRIELGKPCAVVADFRCETISFVDSSFASFDALVIDSLWRMWMPGGVEIFKAGTEWQVWKKGSNMPGSYSHDFMIPTLLYGVGDSYFIHAGRVLSGWSFGRFRGIKVTISAATWLSKREFNREDEVQPRVSFLTKGDADALLADQPENISAKAFLSLWIRGYQMERQGKYRDLL